MTPQELLIRYGAQLALQQAAEADARKVVDFAAKRRERHERAQRRACRASARERTET
jgi:hypothetical protein